MKTSRKNAMRIYKMVAWILFPFYMMFSWPARWILRLLRWVDRKTAATDDEYWNSIQ